MMRLNRSDGPRIPRTGQLHIWQTCRKAGTQSQMGLPFVPPPGERAMTAGCLVLPSVGFAEGQFFYRDAPMNTPRGAAEK